MDEVMVSESSPSTSFAEAAARTICRVCQKQFSQYTCPRCNTRYCSLPCYKGHSIRCTESFMRDNVMEELQQIQPEDEMKRKMMDILKRFHLEEEELNSDHDDDSLLSEEVIQKVLSGSEVRLEDLSAEEIKHFRRAIVSGDLSKMIEPWNPWWKMPSARAISLSPGGNQLVRSLHEQTKFTASSSSPSEFNLSEIPAGPECPLPPLSQLSKTGPSPLLAVHLVDVLYSYCFTLRLHNGDWQFDPLGAAMVAMSMSSVLGNDGRPETVKEALHVCLEHTCSAAYRQLGGFWFGVGLIDDLISLLSLGGDALICLLSDLQRLVQAGEKMLKSEKMEKAKKGESSRRLRGADRKIFFLMCWVHEQPNEAWTSLAGLVEAEKASLSALGHSSSKPFQSKLKGTSLALGHSSSKPFHNMGSTPVLFHPWSTRLWGAQEILLLDQLQLSHSC